MKAVQVASMMLAVLSATAVALEQDQPNADVMKPQEANIGQYGDNLGTVDLSKVQLDGDVSREQQGCVDFPVIRLANSLTVPKGPISRSFSLLCNTV
jgi:hypothetical protein